MSDSLARLADRAAADPFFLAFALAEYARMQTLDDAALAARLGTTADILPHVRLCRTPRGDADGFRADVARIAAKFNLDRDTLADAVRHGQVVARVREAAEAAPDAAAAGFLLAARDRPPA